MRNKPIVIALLVIVTAAIAATRQPRASVDWPAYGNDAGGSAAGRAYVFFGGPGSDAVPDFTQTGEVTLDNLGFAVSGAGDVDGDGYADLMVGAPYSDGDAGRAYLTRTVGGKSRPVAAR